MDARKILLLNSLVGLSFAGCQPPPQFVPTVPPGVEVKDVAPPQKDSEAPSALGESKITEQKLKEAKITKNLELPVSIKPEDAIKDGLKIESSGNGTGEGAKVGQNVTVHYTGKLTSGVKFDSSLDRRTPFQFVLGQGSVIKGWDAGLQGMKVGEKRTLTIPPRYGYGERGTGKIPPNATLVFDIEMIKID